MNKLDSLLTRMIVGTACVFAPTVALAQATPAPAAPPPAPAATPAPAPAPAAAEPGAPVVSAPPPPIEPAAAPAPLPPPPAAPDAIVPPPPPPTQEEVWKMPKINVGAWLRTSLRFQDGKHPKQLDGLSMGDVYGELHLSGNVHPNVGYTLNLNANGLAATAGIEDAIVSFKIHDLLNIWVGQQLVPSDRTNFSGPFFIIPWNYPGVYGSYFIGPIEPYYGRDGGVTAWGDYGEGKFKYFLGAFNLKDPKQTALLSGRLSFAPIGKDGGLWGNSTYYGSQNLLAFGVGGQYERKGSVLKDATGAVLDTAEFGELNADVLGEFKVGEGAVTAEGAYYHFWGKYNTSSIVGSTPNPAKDAAFVLAAYLSPPLAGGGKIQPSVRYQGAGGHGMKMWILDAGVAWIMNGPQLKLMLNFQHQDLDNKKEANAIQLAAQTIMF